MSHPIEQKINLFLEEVCEGKAGFSEDLIQEFGERCKDILRKGFVEKPIEEKKFFLRMSNIGRSLRQLMLEKTNEGKYRPSKEFKLKATIGHLYEAFFLALLKQSGVSVIDHDKKVVLPVGDTNIYGTYDVKIDGKIYDIKTASPFAYEYKFASIEALRKDDAFGYFAQGFGYSLADGAPFGGWIACNKATAEFKVLEIGQDHDAMREEYSDQIAKTVEHVVKTDIMPPCDGVVDEEFNGKKTGNKVLNSKCSFCDFKTSRCHKEIACLPEVNSKAKSPKLKWYIGKIIKPKDKEII